LEGSTVGQRLNITSGSEWESVVGYSRAVRIGNVVEVAGTTAVNERGEVVGPNDAYEQTRFVLTRIKHALEAAGARLDDVIRTRMYVTDISRWQEIGRAHGEVFRDIRPAASMVEVRALISPELMVEIEATALVRDDTA
jgi:enamine deaminase RidA (YjgF/YER057c/UK114 family)